MVMPMVTEVPMRRIAAREYAERSAVAHSRTVGVEDASGLRLARMVSVASMFAAGGSQRAMVEASILRVADRAERRKVTVIR